MKLGKREKLEEILKYLSIVPPSTIETRTRDPSRIHERSDHSYAGTDKLIL